MSQVPHDNQGILNAPEVKKSLCSYITSFPRVVSFYETPSKNLESFVRHLAPDFSLTPASCHPYPGEGLEVVSQWSG
jgi:hypothetical protein